MNIIPLFFSPYEVFSGKFQSTHFILFRLRKSYSTIRIYFIKSSGNSMPGYFYAKISISSFRDSGCCCKSILLFYSLAIHLSSLAVVFLRQSGGFLASHDPVFSTFLKILWIKLLDFPTVFEISLIESLSSLHNFTFSFLSSNDVTDFLPCLPCKCRWRAGVI